MTTFKLGELFCGPGGLAWAAKTACVAGFSISHQWANDYDEATCETYRRNICPENPESVVCADIKKLDLKKLKKFDKIDAFSRMSRR